MPSYLLFLSFFLPLAAANAIPGGRNCQNSSFCGAMEIPYPFGIGSSDCYIEPSFNISCDQSSSPPKAYLTNVMNPYEVIKIDVSNSQVWLNYTSLAGAAFDPPGRASEESPAPSPGAERRTGEELDWKPSILLNMSINLSQTLFTLSENNSITFIGCDDFVRINGINSKVFAGCMSVCVDNPTNGNCPAVDDPYGNGCCQSPIPRGTANLSLEFTDIHEHSREDLKRRLFRWSFAFIGEKRKDPFWYNVNTLNGSDETFKMDNREAIPRPLVLDWRMGIQTCTPKLKISSSYACTINSDCVNFSDTLQGYTCRCKNGYEGNPYVNLGCYDIDECSNHTKNKCKSPSRCKNTQGSYDCICPIGYKKTNDRGCSPSQLIIAFIGVGSGIGFLLFLVICYWLHNIFQKTKDKKRKEGFFKHNGGLLLQQQASGGVFGKMNLFTAIELEKATDHFSETRILGQGAHGTVYKGILSDGRNVAVKKAKLLDENQLEQFINEMVILSQINHKHIVKLFGCCLETEVPLLVYEFVPNGTLFNLIHDSGVEFPITWKMRLKIASDTAGAIAYLHSASSIPVYHRDIKSSNILLDEKYVVKVSDFGGSRLVPVDHTHVTTMVTGTFGYLDPEFFQSGQFTEKSDVYSFEVVLIELLTGEKPISFSRAHDERSLATHFLLSVEAKNIKNILDDEVSRGSNEEVMSVVRLAKRCLNLRGRLRPTMRVVASELENIMKAHIGPTVEEDEEEDYQDFRGHEPKVMMLSSFDYNWTTSTSSFPSSPAIEHPLTKGRL